MILKIGTTLSFLDFRGILVFFMLAEVSIGALGVSIYSLEI
jgi:hypothetical protein